MVTATSRPAISPIGTSAAQAAEERAARSEEYRLQRERLAPMRALARQIILYRTENNLTQDELAALIGSSRTQISRIESGRHMPSLTTLQKIAEALNLKLLSGHRARRHSRVPGICERRAPRREGLSPMMRLLANENFPRAAVDLLRQRGHDVGWIRTDSPGADDRDVIARAVAEQRVLITFDKNFGELAFRQGVPGSCGIVLFR